MPRSNADLQCRVISGDTALAGGALPLCAMRATNLLPCQTSLDK
jgi:hypothetical protein